MSDVSENASPVRQRRGPRRGQALKIALVATSVLIVLVAILYLNRRAAARQLLVGWLGQQGIEAEMEVERVEVDGLVARVRLGDSDNPDVTVERVEVDYAIGTPWSKGGLGLTPSRIRLVRPVLRASLSGDKLSLGSLDPLVERFTARPPRPDSRGPLVLIEQARVRLATDLGPTDLFGDARLDNGKLLRLTARMPATTLSSGDMEARGLEATLDLKTTGDRVAVRAVASARGTRIRGFGGETLRLTVAGDLPYPDVKARRGDGRARLNATLNGARLTANAVAARDAVARLTFDGQTSGWVQTFRIEGAGDIDIRADGLDGPASASAPRIHLVQARTTLARDADGFGWRLEGPASLWARRISGAGLDGTDLALSSSRLVVVGHGGALGAQGPFTLGAGALRWGELSLGTARSRGAIDLAFDGGLRLAASGSLTADRSAWPLLGRPTGGDPAELVEMKRALSAFAVDLPSFSVSSSPSGTRVVLDRPATLRPANGGAVTLNPAATPIFASSPDQPGGGALAVIARRGRGLPEADVSIPAWRLTPGGFSATLDGRAALDFGLARSITLQTQGELASSGGRLTYVANRCMPVTIGRLELDQSDITEIAGSVCPVRRPMVAIDAGAWRADGALTKFDAATPFLALQFLDADGAFTATGGPGGLTLAARVTQATVDDATAPRRFNPLAAAGSARLSDETWTGAFDLRRGDAVLGRLTLAHDGRAGAGGMTIDAPSIIFTDGGLQPADLTPLAGSVGSPASGSVGFNGRVDWSAGAEGSSSGRLTIPGLDFISPAGPVKGLRGTIDFTNLAPLTAAPGQKLSAERLESVAPLTDLTVTFGLDKAALTIEGGDLAVAGGSIRVEPFAVPLDPAQPITGVIVLDRVQLGQLIAGSGFDDKVRLDAVVSGRLPFTSDRERGIRITGGTLSAVQPGRLSIAREALSGLQAGGGGEGVPANTVQDLAYQAMENLSFDLLTAEVNSLDQGRVGVLFRIRGRHDPPEHQELRLSIAEFISREFLNRRLPLPSDTGIDLTLDTTLNADQLVSDLLALNRARDGRPDAPVPDTP